MDHRFFRDAVTGTRIPEALSERAKPYASRDQAARFQRFEPHGVMSIPRSLWVTAVASLRMRRGMTTPSRTTMSFIRMKRVVREGVVIPLLIRNEATAV